MVPEKFGLSGLMQRLRRLFPQGQSRKAALYWNEWQQRRSDALGEDASYHWVDWGDHPVILSLIYEQLFGSPDTDLCAYLRSTYPQFTRAHALSLCCGSGEFEKNLLENGVFRRVTGIDIAQARVDAAREEGDENFHCRTGDVNSGRYGRDRYDVVFAKAALHHIIDLERAFAGMHACLKEEGYLVALDFFGPSRFQWSERQLEAVNDFLRREVPPELKRRGNGTYVEAVSRPSPEAMIALDPSEAARSHELIGFIRSYFNDIMVMDIGGTLLNLIFDPAIINNFRPENPDHSQILRNAFRYERELLEAGEISSDFKFVVARRKAGTNGLANDAKTADA